MKKIILIILILLFVAMPVFSQSWGSWDIFFLDGTDVKTFSGTDNLDMESGNITTTGTVTAGNVAITGLTASSGVYTDSIKQLTSTPPTSGILGYWTRAGTTLEPTNAKDNLDMG